MDKPEFDQYAAKYDRILNSTIPDGLNEDSYFAEYKVEIVAKARRNYPPKRILDFGCGAGRSLPYIEKYFPNSEIWGYDVSVESLQIAASRSPKARLFSNWEQAGNVSFDCILAANVFHHIAIDSRATALKRCHLSLRQGGHLFLFEHNPLNPATRWIFERCPFDADATMLGLNTAVAMAEEAGFSKINYAYTLFFPRPLRRLRRFEQWLGRVPLGAQYYLDMEK